LVRRQDLKQLLCLSRTRTRESQHRANHQRQSKQRAPWSRDVPVLLHFESKNSR
jgi:hypothetical protein